MLTKFISFIDTYNIIIEYDKVYVDPAFQLLDAFPTRWRARFSYFEKLIFIY